MRFLLAICILSSQSLLFAQQSPSDYYAIFSKIDSKDTTGLYQKIFSSENKNPDKFYSLVAKGDYLFAQDNLKDAFDNYNAAFELIKNGPKDTLYALANYKIGSLHYFSNNYPEALKYYNRASLVYNYKVENYQQARLYNLLGSIHIDLISNDLSIKSYQATLAFYKKINDLKRIASTQNNIGIVYTGKKDFINAQKYHDSSLTIRKELKDNYGMGQSYNNIGTMYFTMKEHSKALEYFKLGYENRIIGKAPLGGLIESQVNIGKTYLMLNDKQNAKYWLELGLNDAKSSHNYEMQKRASEQLKELYYSINDFKKAYELQDLYFVIKDSLYGMDKKSAVENLVLQNQFESKIRQDSISNFERIKSEKIVAEEKEKRNTIWFYVLLAGIIFLLIFVFQLYKSNIHKKRTNTIILSQRDALNQKQKEIIDSINYAKRIQESLLPSSKYIERTIKRLKEGKKE